MTKFEWELAQGKQIMAGRLADSIVERLDLTAPIDALSVAASESRRLVAGGENFGDRFDGKLKYRPDKKKFILFYNTKYDVFPHAGKHHARTRFSIGHELGHFFIEAHHNYLRHGGEPHPSRSEFRRNDIQMEREADAFAASLLLPTHLVSKRVNQSRPTLDLVDGLSQDFQTSPACTTFRVVRLSQDPCAVAGIRNGKVAWMFPSNRLIEGSCYPRKGDIESDFARERWNSFSNGDASKETHEGLASDWLSLFGRAGNVEELSVHEHYLPVRLMETLIVLITLDDNDLFGGGDGDSGSFDPDDDDDRPWTKERHDSGD
jgi:Zn-dependent peptidase ImmA (M78 family)